MGGVGISSLSRSSLTTTRSKILFNVLIDFAYCNLCSIRLVQTRQQILLAIPYILLMCLLAFRSCWSGIAFTGSHRMPEKLCFEVATSHKSSRFDILHLSSLLYNISNNDRDVSTQPTCTPVWYINAYSSSRSSGSRGPNSIGSSSGSSSSSHLRSSPLSLSGASSPVSTTTFASSWDPSSCPWRFKAGLL